MKRGTFWRVGGYLPVVLGYLLASAFAQAFTTSLSLPKVLARPNTTVTIPVLVGPLSSDNPVFGFEVSIAIDPVGTPAGDVPKIKAVRYGNIYASPPGTLIINPAITEDSSTWVSSVRASSFTPGTSVTSSTGGELIVLEVDTAGAVAGDIFALNFFEPPALEGDNGSYTISPVGNGLLTIARAKIHLPGLETGIGEIVDIPVLLSDADRVTVARVGFRFLRKPTNHSQNDPQIIGLFPGDDVPTEDPPGTRLMTNPENISVDAPAMVAKGAFLLRSDVNFQGGISAGETENKMIMKLRVKIPDDALTGDEWRILLEDVDMANAESKLVPAFLEGASLIVKQPPILALGVSQITANPGSLVEVSLTLANTPEKNVDLLPPVDLNQNVFPDGAGAIVYDADANKYYYQAPARVVGTPQSLGVTLKIRNTTNPEAQASLTIVFPEVMVTIPDPAPGPDSKVDTTNHLVIMPLSGPVDSQDPLKWMSTQGFTAQVSNGGPNGVDWQLEQPEGKAPNNHIALGEITPVAGDPLSATYISPRVEFSVATQNLSASQPIDAYQVWRVRLRAISKGDPSKSATYPIEISPYGDVVFTASRADNRVVITDAAQIYRWSLGRQGARPHPTISNRFIAPTELEMRLGDLVKPSTASAVKRPWADYVLTVSDAAKAYRKSLKRPGDVNP